MEITVSKFELLRELTATQGVVERKTTIPILSNYLFEAAADKLSITATDLDLSLRTSCNAKVKKEGACTIPARKLHDYVKLLPDADITIKLLENHWVSIRCGRSNTKMVGMARSNFPTLPAFPTAGVDQYSGAALRGLIAKHRLCDCERRIALHAEWRADGAEAGIDHDGRNRRPSPGAHRTQRRKVRRYLRRDENSGAEEGDGRTEVAGSIPNDVEDHRVRQRRFDALLPHRPAAADLAPAHRPIPQLRSRPAARTTTRASPCTATISVRPSPA